MESSSESQVPCRNSQVCVFYEVGEKGMGNIISCVQRPENLQRDHLMVSEILKACERLKKVDLRRK